MLLSAVRASDDVFRNVFKLVINILIHISLVFRRYFEITTGFVCCVFKYKFLIKIRCCVIILYVETNHKRLMSPNVYLLMQNCFFPKYISFIRRKAAYLFRMFPNKIWFGFDILDTFAHLSTRAFH